MEVEVEEADTESDFGDAVLLHSNCGGLQPARLAIISGEESVQDGSPDRRLIRVIATVAGGSFRELSGPQTGLYLNSPLFLRIGLLIGEKLADLSLEELAVW